MGVKPPALARALVRIFAHAEDRDFLLGDLDDRYRELARSHGSRVANRWYWKQALSAVLWSVASRRVRIHPTSWAPWSALREAARSLARTPVFTGVSVLSVGVGIGLATSVFAVAQAIFFTPSPYPDAARLVEIWQTQRPGSHQRSDYLTPARMLVWVHTPMRYLTGVSGYGLAGEMVLQGTGGARRVTVEPIAGDWFGTLGTQPVLGRVLSPQDERAGAEPAAVVSWSFWKDQLGGEASAVGSVLHFHGMTCTVVGVMPRAFETEQVVWVPRDALPPGRPAVAWLGVARLRPGATFRQARQEIEQRSATQVAADSARWAGLGATATPMLAAPSQAGDRSTLWILASVVTAVLLIGLSNLTTLFLVRAQERSITLAVRASLGANTWQLGRGLLMEALLVGLGGSMLGALLALAGTPVSATLVQIAPPLLGWLSVVVAVSLGVLVTAVVGLEPLRRLRRLDVRDLLQRRAAGSGSTRGEHRSRNVLVSVQVAMCVMLVSLLGIFVVAYHAFATIDVGYDARHLVEAIPDYELANMDPTAQWALLRSVDERVRRNPAVSGVAIWEQVMEGYPPHPESDAVIEGAPRKLGPRQGLYRFYEVDPGFFQAAGIPILRGRRFTDADDASAPPVAIVTQDGADAWWPGENPLGHRIKLGRDGEWMTVVGVVSKLGLLGETGRGFLVNSHGDHHMPLLFRSARQAVRTPSGWTAQGNCAMCDGPVVAVRSEGDPTAVERALRGALSTLAPDLPMKYFGTMYDQQMASWGGATITRPGRLVGAGSVVGLLLALAGIVGVVADGVTRRTREIGLRIALGARSTQVLRTVAGESVVTALVGLGTGLAALVALRGVVTRLFFNYEIRALAPGVTAPRLLVGAAALVLTVVIGAALLTARRALKVDPSEALRSE